MPADAGEILLNGEAVSLHSPGDAIARGIAYVPEDRRRHGVVLEMPIEENMTMAIHGRLFPGAPETTAPWPTLLWATGRAELPGHPRLTTWRWHGTPRS